MKKRVLSLLLAGCMLFGSLSFWTTAAEPEGTTEAGPCREGCSLAAGHEGECALYDAGWQDTEDGEWRYGPLGMALGNVKAGGTVKLMKDFYVTMETGVPAIKKPMTLTSADPEHPCKITSDINNHPTLLMVSSDVYLKAIIIDGGREQGLVASGPLVLVQGGNLRLGAGASIQNNRNNNNSRGANWLGGGVFLNGTMTMENGSAVKNCRAWAGGGVAVVNSADSCLTLRGGSIEDCESYQGGGVSVIKGSFKLEEGQVKNCRAIEPESQSLLDFIEERTEIKSPGEGGGVFLSWNHSVMEMNGGAVKGNHAAKSGGGIGCDEGKLTLSAGEVTENRAEEYGGGVLASPMLEVFLSGSIVIAENESGIAGYENYYLDGSEDWIGSETGATATRPFTIIGPVESDIDLKLSRWMHPDKDDPEHPERIYRIVAVPGKGYTITETDRVHFICDDPKYVVRLVEEEGIKKLALTFPLVTYRDGVEGEVFAEETYLCTGGDDTPAFDGVPERENYIFKGWLPEPEEKVNGDAVYTAQWEPVPTYTVTYRDGVEGRAFQEVTHSGLHVQEDTPAFGGVPERENYTFKGWLPEPEEKVNGDAVYTAQWEKKEAPDPPKPPSLHDDDDDDDDDDPPMRPTPTPSPTPSPMTSATPDPTPSPSPSAEPTPELTPAPAPSVTPTPLRSPGTEPSSTPTPLQSPGTEPSSTPTPEPAPTLPPSPEPTVTPESVPVPTPSPDPVPKTGDITHSYLWALCALAALAGIALVLRPRRRRR